MEYALSFRAFGALPVAGGQFDQPAGALKKMRVLLGVYDSLRAWRSRRSKAGGTSKWIEANSGAYDTVQYVETLRQHYGK